MDIGPRIRQLRIRNELTLEELAGRTELTKGYLSQLENDMASPSVATLQDIVEALGTNMSAFFKEEKTEPDIFSEEDFFVQEKDGAKIFYVIPNSQKNEMEPILLELKPGAQSSELLPFEGEEFGYVLSGRVTLVLEHGKHELKKGETFYLHGEQTHCLKNESAHVARILWVTTPPVF